MSPTHLTQTLQQELNFLTPEQLQQVHTFIAFLKFRDRQTTSNTQSSTTPNHQRLQITPVTPGSGYTNTSLEHDAVLANLEEPTP